FECLAQVIRLLYCLRNTNNHRGPWINRHMSKLLPRLPLSLAQFPNDIVERRTGPSRQLKPITFL
ncbi:MAG: hypothetical protein ACI8XD_002147, partial [Thermoproteota archaeon]